MNISVPFSKFPLFLSHNGGNRWIIGETSEFMEYSRGSTQAKLTHTKAELFNPR